MNTFHLNAIKSAVGRLNPIASRKTPKEILRYLRVESAGQEATFEANNLECAARLRVSCEGDLKPCLLDSSKVHAFLGSCRADTVSVELRQEKAILTCGGARLTLNTPDVTEFPAFRAVETEGRAEVNTDVLATAIRRGSVYLEEANSRFSLSGAYFDFEDGLSIVSTDTHGLAVSKCGAEVTGKIPSVIVPASSIAPLLGFLDAAPGLPLSIRSDGNLAVFEHDRWTFGTRLIEGRFVRWRDIAELNRRNSARMIAGELLSAVQAASLMANKEDGMIAAVDLLFSEDELEIRSKESEQGASRATVPSTNDGMLAKYTLGFPLILKALRTIEPESAVYLSSSSWMVFVTTDDGHLFAIAGQGAQEDYE